jgi:hypothetical protein
MKEHIVSAVDDKKARAAALREEMLQIIEGLSLEQLAGLAKHQYDEEATAPPFRTAGQTFLFHARDAFVAWARRRGRFPSPAEADDAATAWHRETASGSQVADAFVSLQLYYSAHAADAPGADISGLTAVLDLVAETIAFNLTMEYGPQV